jgi:membrane-associated phospholipid phosphatase
LHLTLGALVLFGACWAFGEVAASVVRGEPLTVLDIRLAQWLYDHTAPGLTYAMLVITHSNGVVAISLYAFALAVYLARTHEWYWLTTLVLAVPLGEALNVLLKLAFHRTRPSFENPLLVLTTYSFPSGHVAGATLFYGLLAAFLMTKTASWRRRAGIITAALTMVVLVALSRMYLGVHYLSDVLAAFAEAVAWLTICLTAVRTLHLHRGARHAPIPAGGFP